MTVLVIVLHSHSFLMGQKMSMISRIITTGAIYKKVILLLLSFIYIDVMHDCMISLCTYIIYTFSVHY